MKQKREPVKMSFRKWSPRELWTPVMTILIALMISKLLLFASLWCAGTSWSGLLNLRLYIHIILLSFVLSVPIGMFRRKWLQVGIMVAVDIGLSVLLCHAETGSMLCPVIEWPLMEVLPEAVAGSVHLPAWGWSLSFMTTLASFFVCLKHPGRTPVPMLGKAQYCGYLLGWSLLAWLTA